jgi:hypothetical protein
MRKAFLPLLLVGACIFLSGCATPGRSKGLNNYKSAVIYYEDPDEIKVLAVKDILDRVKFELKKDLWRQNLDWTYMDEGEKEKADLWIVLSPREYILPNTGLNIVFWACAIADPAFICYLPFFQNLIMAVGYNLALLAFDSFLIPFGKFDARVTVYDAKTGQTIATMVKSAENTDDPKKCAGLMAEQIAEGIADIK